MNSLSRCIVLSAICSFLVALSLSSASGQDEPTLPEDDKCITCHVDSELMPEGLSNTDVHLSPGLSCAGCHGGDPTTDDEEIAMSPEAGFVGVPARHEISTFCGKCHSDIDFMRQYQPRIPTDQVAQYATSVHGKRLAAGDGKVADCTSCHTSHAILPAKDTRSTVHALNVPTTCDQCHGDSDYMSNYGIPTDQFKKFAKGVHGVALLENHDTGAPACNDCHGNHGATPPGVTSVGQVCGHCHVNNMQYFQASPMAAAFEEHEFVGCEECHGNHDIVKTHDDMVGTGDQSVCVDCHEEGDSGWEAAKSIRTHLRTLVDKYDEALAKQDEVQRFGMDDEEIEFLLQEAHQSLIQSRTLVHTFDPEKVGERTGEGLVKASSALEIAFDQIKEYDVRRRGFGLATLFITLLVVALFFKIRQMEA